MNKKTVEQDSTELAMVSLEIRDETQDWSRRCQREAVVWFNITGY